MPADPSSRRRFDVALSFPGEHRDYVKDVAEHLTTTFPRERILYDKFHEAEFARLDLDIYLPNLYRAQSELVVLFLCPEYSGKRWCRLEWRHIRQLIATVEAGRIMLLRYGHEGDMTELGILSGDGTINFKVRSAKEIAEKIAERYRLSQSAGLHAESPVDQTAVATISALAALREQVQNDGDLTMSRENLNLILSHTPLTLDDYRLARIAEWSQDRYAIDKRFTPLTLLVDQSELAQGPRWQAQPRTYDDLRTVLNEIDEPALVVLGPPGCGKSTLLRRLELDLAVEALRNFGNPDNSPPVSLFLPLNSYGKKGDTPLSPQEWIRQEWQRRGTGFESLDTLLRQGKLILLLDAVNEMPHASEADYGKRIELWRDFLTGLTRSAPGTRVVFSCRELDYSATLSTPELRVPHVRIERLGDTQVEQFLSLYSPEHGQRLWRQLKGTRQLDLFRSPFYLRMLVAQSDRGGAALAGRAELFTGFVRQALLRELEADSPLLQPAVLLDHRDHTQLVGRRWRDAYELPARGALIPALAKFAFDLQQRRQGGELAQVRVGYDPAVAMLALQAGQADQILKSGAALQVLEQQFDEVYFAHQLLQEYFAARYLTTQPVDFTALARTAWRAGELTPTIETALQTLAAADPLPAVPTTGWEETFMLAAAMVPRPEAWVRALATENLRLAGRCAAQPDVNVSEALRDEIRQMLVARSRDLAADLRERIAAGHALGELGDPRFERQKGPHGDYLLPPTITIAGGHYSIGSDEGLYEDESPVHPVTLAPFALGQFPVTNAEYRCFIEAGGYDDERWWASGAARRWRRGEGATEGPKRRYRQLRDWYAQDAKRIDDLRKRNPVDAAEWIRVIPMTEQQFESELEEWCPPGRQTQPAFWNNPAFNQGLQPVVGIGWHEANAYCAWICAQTRKPYRLPSEVEWEAAARGQEARPYPWGNTFDSALCNSFESHARGTTPVGVFPGGDTREGLIDMSGNVWEWTSSLYRPYPYCADMEHEDVVNIDDRRVLRGGSWGIVGASCRCACRSTPHLDDRHDVIGFRVCCGPAII